MIEMETKCKICKKQATKTMNFDYKNNNFQIHLCSDCYKKLWKLLILYSKVYSENETLEMLYKIANK